LGAFPKASGIGNDSNPQGDAVLGVYPELLGTGENCWDAGISVSLMA